MNVPARDWAVFGRILRRAVALLSGDGGVGKSILALQLSCAHVLGRDWLGTMPEPGPVLYVNCEDDADELHRRVAGIIAHYGARFSDLRDLHIAALAGRESVMAAPDRSGIVQATPLLAQLRRTAMDLHPVLIVLDTAADMYGGNENDRGQVRQFIGLLRGVAIDSGAAVLLLSHPSLTGIASDSGLSGSTAWNNSVRSRLFLKSAGDKDQPDLRELEVRKSNYGPVGESVRLVWRNGVFVPISAPSSMEKAAAESAAEILFLKLFDLLTQQGQTFSHHKTAPSYAPRLFAEHKDANRTGATTFAAAMQRLLDAGTIHVETYGRPSRPNSKLVRS